jgi:hypothetical protein
MKSGKYMRLDALLSSRLNIDEKLVKICEETHNLYTKAKDSLIEAYGGEDNLPKDFTSIRPNFIEQLKKGLDMDDEEAEDEEQQQQQQLEEPEVTTQTRSSIGESRSRIRAKAEMVDQPTTMNSIKDEFFNNDDDDDDDQLMDMNVDDNGISQKKTKTKSKTTTRRSKKKFK